MSSRKRKPKRSDFVDGASTSGLSGYEFDVSSQKRKRSDFADGASTSGCKYDVFLSFRGADTRLTIADIVYVNLVDAGISVFRDNDELSVGGNIGPELKRAIVDARIYVPIFSKNYVSSAWCLQELEHMVKCRKENAEREIVPIFYDVSPSDVKLRTGSYGQALLKHEGRYGEETVREWREALMEVGNLSGLDARGAPQGKLVNNLVRELSIKLKKRQKVLPDHLVGIDDQVKGVIQLLDCSSLDVRFLTVHGMGGIGKTTLAKAVFNKIAPLFDGCSFLSDVRERSLNGGTVNLQRQLLSDILNRSTDVNDVDDGIILIREKFRYKRVLIVLDDMDELEQLMKLKGNCYWLGPGSRVIVTTRNVGLLAFLPKENFAYEMREMNHWHALQLFSKHAFEETLPPNDLETLSSEIVATTGGIPLALEASGSFLRGRSSDIWLETLRRLGRSPHEKVQQTLRISIFLDIACFFTGEDRSLVTYYLKDTGCCPESGLAALTDMSLLKMDRGRLQMHGLISDFAMNIAMNEQNRLWLLEECLALLREPMLTSQAFAALPKLRGLQVEGVNFTGDYNNVFRELRWLSWDCFPAEFEATNFSPENLVVLKLSNAEIGDDWPGWHQILKSSKLKVLELGECSHLTRLPDLSALSTLQRLTVRNCQSLVEIGESIGKLVQLNYWEIDACTYLRGLPEEVGCLKDLKELIVRGTIFAPVNGYLPHSIGNLQSLKRLVMESVGISELPRSIGELKKLERLCLSRCDELKELPDSIGGLESLLELDLSFTKVTELPDSIGNLKKVKVMRISHSEITRIPGAIGGVVEKLEEFHAEKCVNLKGKIPSGIESLSFLKILNLSHTCIRSVPTTINELSHLRELHLEGCHKLKQIPELPASLIILNSTQSVWTIGEYEGTDRVELHISAAVILSVRLEEAQRGALVELPEAS
ncbi:hypothetical protein BT93_H1230 [Corymbia citriodora subsp. variegata]|nr:hypothetical protein BT93_H1230 [Corymbia citriodora subsp. variegata]